MGFLSGLFSTPKVSVPASGLYAQPKAFQQLYSGLLGQANSLYNNGGATQAFTPMPQTADETAAFSAIRGGFAPTAQSLQSDIAMQMNPYDQFVTDEINRQAGGQYSLLKQGMTDAGQFGSNRMMLGANDIDLSRLNQIGAFKQQGYNQALGNAMSVLPSLRAADVQGLLGIGDFQRNLAMQTQQAPYSAIQSGLGLLGGFGQMGQGTQASSSGGKFDAGKAIGTAIQVAGLFSDERLKENIVPVGEENGFPTYEFNYIGDPKKYVGVIAQEVAEKLPDAVHEVDGFLSVDYDKIGVVFREAE